MYSPSLAQEICGCYNLCRAKHINHYLFNVKWHESHNKLVPKQEETSPQKSLEMSRKKTFIYGYLNLNSIEEGSTNFLLLPQKYLYNSGSELIYLALNSGSFKDFYGFFNGHKIVPYVPSNTLHT